MSSDVASTRSLSGPSAERGFSLIEILVVITIIGMLMGFSAVAVSRYRETGRITQCDSQLKAIALLCEGYAERMGDYPPSRLVALGVKDAPNEINMGVEALCAALRAKDYAGGRPNDDWLGNTDEDSSASLDSIDGTSALLELLDPWDNPIVYIVQSDYEQDFTVRLDSEGLIEDVSVRATKNPMTGAWFRFESYQLRSAGPDGLLDTDDDIANYEIPDAEG